MAYIAPESPIEATESNPKVTVPRVPKRGKFIAPESEEDSGYMAVEAKPFIAPEPEAPGVVEQAVGWLAPSDEQTSQQIEDTFKKMEEHGVPKERVNELRQKSAQIQKAVPGPIGAALDAATKAITWNVGGNLADLALAGGLKVADVLEQVPEEQQPTLSEYFTILSSSARLRERETAKENPVPAIGGGLVGAVASPFNKVAALAGVPAIVTPAVEGTAMAVAEAAPEIASGDMESAGKQIVSNALVASAFVGTAHLVGAGVKGAKNFITGASDEAKELVEATVNNRSLQDAAMEVIESHAEQEHAIAKVFTTAEHLDELRQGNFSKVLSEKEQRLIRTRIWNGLSDAERVKIDGGPASPDITDKMEAWVSTEVKEFAAELTGRMPKNFESAIDDIEGFVSREGAAHSEARYLGRRMGEEMLRASEDTLLPAARGKLQSLRYMLDGSMRLENIANRHKLEITPIAGALSAGVKRSIIDENYWLEDLKHADGSVRRGIRSVVKQIAESGIEPSAIRAVVEKPKKYAEILAKLTKPQKDAVEAYKTLTDDMLTWAQKRGLNIKRLGLEDGGGYVMHTLRPMEEIIVETQRRVRAVEREFGSIASWTKEKFAQLTKQAKEVAGGPGEVADKDVNLLLWGVRYITGDEITTPLQFVNAISKARDPGAIAARTVSKAGVSFERDVANPMPTWLRETDVTKLLPMWASSVARHLNLRDELPKLSGLIRVLEKRNDALGAKYVDTLIRDLTGGRYDTPKSVIGNAFTSATAALRNSANIARENKQTIKAAGLDALSFVPELPQKLMSNMYAYWLGASPLAAIKNSTQTALVTMPHITAATGNAYGAKLFARGTVQLSADMATGKLAARFAEAEAKGLLSERAAEFYEIMKNGKAAGLGGAFATANSKLNQLAMWTFDKSERIQRMMTINIADEWAKDLLAGKKDAITAVLQGTDAGYSAAIMRAVRNGKNEEARDLLRKFLVGKTQFNYDIVNMSEFGRSWGPLFNMFAKWPATIAGDILERVENKQYKQLMIKYGSGLMVAALADQLATPPEDRVGWEKFLLGKGSFTKDWSPAGAVGGMSAMGRPAVTDVTGKIWDSLVNEQKSLVMEGDFAHAVGKSAWSPLLPTATFFKLFANLSDAIDNE